MLHQQLERIGVSEILPCTMHFSYQMYNSYKGMERSPTPHDFHLEINSPWLLDRKISSLVTRWILSLPSSLSSHPQSLRIQFMTRLFLQTRKRMVDMATMPTALLHDCDGSSTIFVLSWWVLYSPFTSSLLNSTALQDMTVYSTNTLGHFLLPISNWEFRISFVLLHHFSLTFFIGMDRRQDVRRLDARFWSIIVKFRSSQLLVCSVWTQICCITRKLFAYSVYMH